MNIDKKNSSITTLSSCLLTDNIEWGFTKLPKSQDGLRGGLNLTMTFQSNYHYEHL